jgi:signal transduction histidine kinase
MSLTGARGAFYTTTCCPPCKPRCWASAGFDVSQLGLMPALRRLLQEEFAGAFDGVTWEVEPAAEEKAQRLSAMSAEVLFYAAREAIRNAARHGRGGDAGRPLRLRVAAACGDGLRIVVEDDGVGLGVSQAAAGGGQGVALQSAMMAVIGGAWETESQPGQFTRVTLVFPEGG